MGVGVRHREARVLGLAQLPAIPRMGVPADGEPGGPKEGYCRPSPNNDDLWSGRSHKQT